MRFIRQSQSFTRKLFFSFAAAFLAICYRRMISLPHAMVLVLIYGKRVSLSCDISDPIFFSFLERDAP
jgi:hypothetical protein